MTYFLISVPFLLLCCAVWVKNRRRYPRQAAVTATVLVLLLILTIIFDNLMIAAGLVGYAGENNSGITIGLVPVEDLFYPLAAALVVAALWPGKGTRP